MTWPFMTHDAAERAAKANPGILVTYRTCGGSAHSVVFDGKEYKPTRLWDEDVPRIPK